MSHDVNDAHEPAKDLSPRAREIVAAARKLLTERGWEGLTMRAVAEQLGIRAPSIYKHFSGKEALEAALISDGMAELAQCLEGATRRKRDRLLALGRAYRAFAKTDPALYRLMTERPLRRDLMRPGVEARAARPVVDAVGGDNDRGRALWAFLHGMVMFELNEQFPADANLDIAWRYGLRRFSTGAGG